MCGVCVGGGGGGGEGKGVGVCGWEVGRNIKINK